MLNIVAVRNALITQHVRLLPNLGGKLFVVHRSASFPFVCSASKTCSKSNGTTPFMRNAFWPMTVSLTLPSGMSRQSGVPPRSSSTRSKGILGSFSTTGAYARTAPELVSLAKTTVEIGQHDGIDAIDDALSAFCSRSCGHLRRLYVQRTRDRVLLLRLAVFLAFPLSCNSVH